jgi:hypothetical protein
MKYWYSTKIFLFIRKHTARFIEEKAWRISAPLRTFLAIGRELIARNVLVMIALARKIPAIVHRYNSGNISLAKKIKQKIQIYKV